MKVNLPGISFESASAKRLVCFLFFLLFLFFVQNGRAEIPKYRHDHINIFPVEKIVASEAGIAIDGDLSDWQKDTFVIMANSLSSKDRFSLSVAFAYGKTGLLFAAKVIDSTPMQNQIDPVAQPNKGWAGDCLQFRFIADASILPGITHAELEKKPVAHERLSTFLFWNYVKEKLPAVHVSAWWRCKFPEKWQNITKTIVGKEANVSFIEGKGKYFIEGLIPWKLLRVKLSPVPGSAWIMNIQPLWGGSGVNDLGHNFYDCVINAGLAYQTSRAWGRGYFVKPGEVKAKLKEQQNAEKQIWAEKKTQIKVTFPVKYNNPAKGFVSLAICKSDGQIVRTLLTKQARNRGDIIEKWDGLDDDGIPVPPGKYMLKALTHPGLKAKFVCSVMNSGDPSWVTADGKGGWSGDHGLPVDVDCAENGLTFMLWEHNELGTGAQAVDANGKKVWGYYLDRGAFDGFFQALAYDKYEQIIYLAQDGLYDIVANAKGKKKGRGGLMAIEAKSGRRTALPWGKGKLEVTVWDRNLLKQKGSRLTADLAGLAVSAEKIFCSLHLSNKIITIDKKSGAVVSSYPITHPLGLVYSEKRNLLYALSGDSIVEIDLNNKGKVKTIIEQGIEQPRGLALDREGNLYASVWGKQMQVRVYSPDGKFLHSVGKDGGRPPVGKFKQNGMLNPVGISVDPMNRLWVMEFDDRPKRQSVWDAKTGRFIRDFYGNCEYSVAVAVDPKIPEHVYLHGCRFMVDYESGAWKVDSTLSRIPFPCYKFMFHTYQIGEIAGKKFACIGPTPHGGTEIFALENDLAKLVYLVSSRVNLKAQFGIDYQDLPGNSSKRVAEYNTLFWHDKNSDNIVQKNEFNKYWKGHLQSQRRYGGNDFYPDGSFIMSGRVFRPQGLDAKGIPMYPHPNKVKPINYGKLKTYTKIETVPVLNTDFQEFYTLASEHYVRKVREGKGKQGIYRFSNNGNLLWRYARVAIEFAGGSAPAETGDIHGAIRILGQAKLPQENGGAIVTVISYFGYYVLLNEDGLYIDHIGEDRRSAPEPGMEQVFTESWSGTFFRHPETGKLYIIGGDTDARILEIKNWEKIKRFAADKVIVTPVQYAAAFANTGTGKSAISQINEIKVKPATPKLNHALEGWNDAEYVTIKLKGQDNAEVALAYDQDNLYAIFKVDDKTPWQNSSSDWRYLFKGGDALDIRIGTGKVKQKSQAGEIRIVIAPAQNNQGFQAVGIWSKVFSGMEKQPQAYVSPVWTKKYERVALIKNVRCVVRKMKNGYIAQIALPWRELNFSPPQSNSQLRGDLGVLLSDSGGRRTVLRRYLFNHSQISGITMDAPAESMLEPEHWGKFIFK